MPCLFAEVCLVYVEGTLRAAGGSGIQRARYRRRGRGPRQAHACKGRAAATQTAAAHNPRGRAKKRGNLHSNLVSKAAEQPNHVHLNDANGATGGSGLRGVSSQQRPLNRSSAQGRVCPAHTRTHVRCVSQHTYNVYHRTARSKPATTQSLCTHSAGLGAQNIQQQHGASLHPR